MAEVTVAGTPRAAFRTLMVINTDWYFCLHWAPLARVLRRAGFEVAIAAAEERECRPQIEADGFRFLPLCMGRRSLAPWREARAIWQLVRLYRRERPDVVHHVTIKPVLYGSLAARAVGVGNIVNSFPGLGYLFQRAGAGGAAIRRVALLASRVCLGDRRVFNIFQNSDHCALFRREAGVPVARSTVIRGVGVDVERFAPTPQPTGVPIVLFAGRLLWDKGVAELVEASRRLRALAADCRVVLVGVPDPENPSFVPAHHLLAWQDEGTVEWWGLRNDMPSVLGQASIVVLPSYSEGVPTILLEAAACGRPIVTTATPGCREVVRDGVNGLLVPPRDAAALAAAIHRLLVEPELRAHMGARGREIAVAEFSRDLVHQEMLSVYERLLAARWPAERLAALRAAIARAAPLLRAGT